jgi:hypothetical protein
MRAFFALIAVIALSAAITVPALAASGGDSNRGDIWVTSSPNPGPGHAMEPHLPCVSTIYLWGDKMGDASGTYTIDSWPPSGNGSVAYRSTWRYNQATGGKQIISRINANVLIANARAAGAAPVNKNGYHFKIQFVQDPQKHKTFWIGCTASSSVKGGGGTSGGTTSRGGHAQPAGVPGTSTSSGSAAVGTLAQTGGGLPLAGLLGLTLLGLTLLGLGLTLSYPRSVLARTRR